ncbi:MAG: ATP-grasp domain-containing protein [Caldilineae bacterium]|nr:MAG: ATP-grasp domain-containing protein [Caldilineae bacterium]
MFNKVLIANRGEIAVRIIRTLRDMGIWTIAVYHEEDIHSLHVRLADEAIALKQKVDDPQAAEILEIAHATGAEAIHPGYSFGAERYDFARPVEKEGFVFIGPPSQVIRELNRKVTMLERAEQAGFRTPRHSDTAFNVGDMEAIRRAADELGYPVVIKARRGGRGRGVRLVRRPEQLERMVQSAGAEAMAVYHDSRIYLERAIYPVLHVDVQILADRHGNVIHLGERCSALQHHNQKIICETPAPCLSEQQRRQVWEMAIELARLFGYENAGTVEFLVEPGGEIYFSDFKARIQIEHPVTEMVTGIDLVQEQLRLAAGEPLRWRQQDIRFEGHAMQCRINAEDPWKNFLPSPGSLRRFRLPGGLHVRVDTYGYTGGYVPRVYDPLLAKVIVWGESRDACIGRMRRALQDFIIQGIPTNLPLHQGILNHPAFLAGRYEAMLTQEAGLNEPADEAHLRDLAVIMAVAYMRRHQAPQPVIPERLTTGWHRSARRLPQ